jgi:pantoate--beta-alanine ligase
VAVIQQMVRDLHLPIDIVPGPTIREEDGLAMSSRNAYLTPEERKAAAVLFRALGAARALIACGERRADAVRTAMRNQLATEPVAQVEYAEVVDAETFQPVEQVAGRLVLPLAVRLGGTRLIDNIQLTVGD